MFITAGSLTKRITVIFCVCSQFDIAASQVDFTSSPPKVQITKPKIYLLCELVIPAKSAVKLNA